VIDIDIIRAVALVLSISLFIIGFFKPVLMPLSYLTCFFFNLPYYYPVLVDYRYEPIIAVVGTLEHWLEKCYCEIKFQYNKYSLFLGTILISFLLA
jgi:hypothetical protein